MPPVQRQLCPSIGIESTTIEGAENDPFTLVSNANLVMYHLYAIFAITNIANKCRPSNDTKHYVSRSYHFPPASAQVFL